MTRRRTIDDLAAEAIATVALAQQEGGRAALKQPIDKLPARLRDRLTEIMAGAAAAARAIADKTPLDRRKWALGKMAETVENTTLPIETRMVALRLFCDVQANEWDKHLEAFPPTPQGAAQQLLSDEERAALAALVQR